MALEFMDGFDHYATDQLAQKWTGGVNTTSGSVGAFGRNGTNGWRSWQNSEGYIAVVLGSQATRVVGFSFCPVYKPWRRLDDLALHRRQHVARGLRLNLGTLYVTRNGTTLATGTTTLTLRATGITSR